MGIMRRWGSPWARGDALRTNHASIDVITQPLTEPVSLAEVQRHLRIDVDTETPSLEVMLVAARQKVEAFLRRALISQTIQLTLDWGPAWVELPRPPLQSVTSIVVTGSLISAAGRRWSDSPNATLSNTVRCGNSA